MRHVERFPVRALLALALLAACRATAPAPAAPLADDEPPPFAAEPGAPPREASAVDRLAGYFPNAELTTDSGTRVRFYDDCLRDKLVLVQFFYTECEGACPPVTSSLCELQEALGERLGRDVFLLSLTLDPERDGPAELAAHRLAAGARPGWTFLTGARADIDAIRRRLGVYDPDPIVDADKSQHSAKLVVGNERLGRWASIPGAAGPKRILRLLERIEGPRPPAIARTDAP